MHTQGESFPPVLHTGVDRNPGQDGSMWDWFAPAGQTDSGDTATEIIYPKRLVQQIKSEEEMAHEYLDTRVKNGTGETSVSLYPQICLFHTVKDPWRGFRIPQTIKEHDKSHYEFSRKYFMWVMQ